MKSNERELPNPYKATFSFMPPLFEDEDRDDELMQGLTPLFNAALDDDLPTLKALLKKGTNINERNVTTAFGKAAGATALHAAVCVESLPVISHLLDAGANPELCDAQGLTPLMRAAESGATDIVRLLLDRGAQLRTCNKHDETAFHIAAARNMPHILHLLSDYKDAEKWSDQPNKYGFTPLMKACSHGALDAIKLLVKIGADVHVRCHRGDSLLHLAVASGDAKTVRWALKQGIEANDTNKEGTTPLHIASMLWESSEIISMLVQAGADVERRNGTGDTPLCTAARKERINTLMALLKAGADINTLGCNLGTALHIAALLHFERSTKLFLKYGADPNTPNRKGYTPLHLAAAFYEPAVMKALLKAGAHVNSCSHTGMTPLMMAAVNGEDAATRALLKAGADATMCACGTISPLEIAETFGHPKTARIYRKEYEKLKFTATFSGKSVKGLEAILRLREILE